MITVNTREDFLRELAIRVPCGSIGAEIGVLHGDFSQKILDNLNPERLLLIDPFKKNGKSYNAGLNYLPSAYSTDQDFKIVCDRFRETDRITIIRAFSYDAVFRITNNYFDFIYHDASHILEDVYRDLSEWLPKIKQDGLICGHDYIEHESFGVMRAVDEFCSQYNFEMIIFNENGGDYALKRK